MNRNIARLLLVVTLVLVLPSLAVALTKTITARDGSNMVLVPAGEFVMGDGVTFKDSESTYNPQHTVYLDAYYIGKYAVTNMQYAWFVKETGHRPPDNDFWNKPEKRNHPVTNVSWHDAMAYAKWAGCELPTEAQWEKAAQGPTRRESREGSVYVPNFHGGGKWEWRSHKETIPGFYPWGPYFDPSKLRHAGNRGNETTAPVDAYREGASPSGTYQQAGNVNEWCFDWYARDYYKSPEASRNPRGPASGSERVLRGGHWGASEESDFLVANRFSIDPSRHGNALGFRLAMLESHFVKLKPLDVDLCVRGTPAQVQAAIKAGADVNWNVNANDGWNGSTPLHRAARHNRNPEVITVLLKAGADMEARDEKGCTPLHRAATYNPEGITVLLKAGADMEARDKVGQTPLHYATQANPEGITVLLKAGADIKVRDYYGDTPLHRAATGNDPEVITMLLKAGADVNARDENGCTPLHHAARLRRDNTDRITLLLKAGAGVNARDKDGGTPLHNAANFNNPEGITVLLKAGADANARDKNGERPIDFADRNNLEGTTALEALRKASK